MNKRGDILPIHAGKLLQAVTRASFLLVGVSFAVPSPIQRDVIRIPSGSPIAVDGKVSANEWEDSKFVMLPVAKNWMIGKRRQSASHASASPGPKGDVRAWSSQPLTAISGISEYQRRTVQRVGRAHGRIAL
jgi:hypothetical protein